MIMKFLRLCIFINNKRYQFVDFENIKDYKGKNIDILGRAIPIETHSRGQFGNKEILLRNFDGDEIPAVFMINNI